MLFLQHASIIIHCLLSNSALWLSGFSHRSPFSEMRRTSSAQLFGEETGKSSPKMDCIFLNNFQHYCISNGIKWWKTFVISWFCDCVLTHFKSGHRNSLSEFRWHFRCVLCGTLKLELYTITWHLKFALEWENSANEMKWLVDWRECDNLIFRFILFVSMCKIHSILLTLDHWNLYWDC